MSSEISGYRTDTEEYWGYMRDQLERIVDPKQKFVAFDEFTDAILLTSFPFGLFRRMAQSSEDLPWCSFHGALSVAPLASRFIIDHCQQLAEQTIRGLRPIPDRCSDPDMHIYTKMHCIMRKVFLSPKFQQFTQSGGIFYENYSRIHYLSSITDNRNCSCEERINRDFDWPIDTASTKKN